MRKRIEVGAIFCACAACAGLVGEVIMAIYLDSSECLKEELPGICREWREEATLPEHTHTDPGSYAPHPAAQFTAAIAATGTSVASQWARGSSSRS